jgi:hypothetical protein
VKHTPVPELSPILPNTICTTFTAVPSKPVIRSTRRYVTAFSAFHDPNTAPIAPQSCSSGSSGKSFDVRFLKCALYSPTNSRQPSAGTCVSSFTPTRDFIARNFSSSSSLGNPITTLEYICTNRR